MSLLRWKPGLILTQSPADGLTYGLDWTEWLADVPAGDDPDTISTSAWIITGADAALTQSNDTNDETSTTVKLSAGTAGVSYLVTNRITTAAGLSIDRSFSLRIVQK